MSTTAAGSHPALALSWEGRPAELLPAVAPLVDVLEIVPDSLRGPDDQFGGDHLRALDAAAERLPVTFHGVGLSIGVG